MALMQLSAPSCRYGATGNGGNQYGMDRSSVLPNALSGTSCCRLPPALSAVSVSMRPIKRPTKIMASAAETAPRRSAQDVKLTWGVHTGKTLGMLPDDYLHWLVNTVKADWGRLAQEVLEERRANPSYNPRPPPPPRPQLNENSATNTGSSAASGFSFGFKRYAKENIDYVRSVDLEAGRRYPECCDEPEFPSKDDFTRMIKNAGDTKNFKEAQRVHARVYNSEFRRNRYLANLLIDMYEKCGALLEARRVFNSVNQPDIGCWNLMLRAYAKHGELQDAREIFDLMPKRDAMSWELIIRVYNDKGNTEEADRLRAQSGLPDSDKGGRVSVPEVKPQLLCFHNEKMSVAFNISTTNPGTPMWFVKNLCLCADCHKSTKVISKVIKKQITVRDATGFHHFENGVCTCGA